MNGLLIDLTSIIASPILSGIQRVERELLRNWPDRASLIPCAIEASGAIRQMPDEVFDILCPADGATGDFLANQEALAKLSSQATILPSGEPRRILNLELFFDRWRADAYDHLCDTGWCVHWLVYDFMPWLHPELFSPGITKHCMHYLRMLRRIPHVAFISEQTRNEYHTRVMRRCARTGPVLPLGADGLGLERQSWRPGRRDIVMIGTIEKRKNFRLVMAAFKLLWSRGVDARLVLAGRVHGYEIEPLAAFAKAAGPERVLALDNPPDDILRDLLRDARAVLYASNVEGFGLPPYEALYCGIPTIAAAHIPSMQLVPAQGHIALPTVSVESVADAVASILDDEVAAALWVQAEQVTLPTWRSFAMSTFEWTQSTG